MGCSPNRGLFRNTCQKESQRPKETHFLTSGNLFYPRLALLITYSPPYALTLIASEPSHKQTAINTLPSKGTKDSMNNIYIKLSCLKHQRINPQKHHLCCKTSRAFTFHKRESCTMEVNWLAQGHQGKSVPEETKGSTVGSLLCPTTAYVMPGPKDLYAGATGLLCFTELSTNPFKVFTYNFTCRYHISTDCTGRSGFRHLSHAREGNVDIGYLN